MIRDLRLIAYFRQCLPRDFPVFSYDDLVQGFAAIDLFQLPLSKIEVIDLPVHGRPVYRSQHEDGGGPFARPRAPPSVPAGAPDHASRRGAAQRVDARAGEGHPLGARAPPARRLRLAATGAARPQRWPWPGGCRR